MKYHVSELIDLGELQGLMAALYEATGINHALLDREGQVLTAVGWKRVCTDFHRANPQSCQRCLVSDRHIFDHLDERPYVGYECLNGLFDYATPIRVDGEHVANIFTGQIFHQPPDPERFRRQAEEFGFNVDAYLAAAEEVEVTALERMPGIMAFLVSLAQTLGQKGLLRLRQLEAEQKLQELNLDLRRRIEERTGELSDTNRLLVQKEERLQRLNRTLLLLSDANTSVLQATDEKSLLPAICRLIVEQGGYPLAYVSFAETDKAQTVRPVAHWGNEGGFLADLRLSWADTEFGRGPTGTAIRTGTSRIVEDTGADPAVAPWRQIFLRMGYRSGISLPLISQGRILGALTIFGSEAGAFGAEEVMLLEKLANNLAFGIADLRARSQLSAANRELQAFTYAASHDLKAPLRGINGFATLLDRRYRERLEGEGLVFLDYIRRDVGRMTLLIDDLLTYCRMDHGSRSPQPVEIASVVQAVVEDRRQEIQRRGAVVRLDVPTAAVLADASGLAQVLRNLLGNALKYSAQATPPQIEVRGEILGAACRLWIRDNGVGFDMEYHDRIFEIFQRLHTYEEYPGTGIGLALVKKAMERMGGRTWAESAPGQGAVFFLELPCAKSRALSSD